MNESLPPRETEQTPLSPQPTPPPMPQWAKVVVAILAIIGGLTVLLAVACFGMIAAGR